MRQPSCPGRRRITTARLFLACLLAAPSVSGAQRTIGPDDDATTLPAGMLRVRTHLGWERAWERFGAGTPGRSDGRRLPLAAWLHGDSIGTTTLPTFLDAESAVRQLAGAADFHLLLGDIRTRQRTSVLTTPLGIDVGLTDRVTLGVVLPYREARSEVQLFTNATGSAATVGWNPSFGFDGARSRSAAITSELEGAASWLDGRLTACEQAPTSAGCAALLAASGEARRTGVEARQYAGLMTQVFGGSRAGSGSVLVPLAGSPAYRAIEGRLNDLRARLQELGAPGLTSALPIGAPGALTAADLQRLLTDSVAGFRYRPLASSATRGFGDLDVGLLVNVFDTFGPGWKRLEPRPGLRLRQALGATWRIGGGMLDDPSHLADLATGDLQDDLELRSLTDIGWGRWWGTVAARWTIQRPGAQSLRIPESPELLVTPASRLIAVERDPGDELELTVAPRVQLGDYFSVGAQYRFRSRWRDRLTELDPGDLVGRPTSAEVDAYAAGSAFREHRIGWGASFSTVAAWRGRRANFPIEASYWHAQSLRGAGVQLPMTWTDQVQLRVYVRLWGR